MPVWLQNLVPQLLFSRMMGALARWRCGALLHWVINWFVGHYGVNLAEADRAEAEQYDCFHDFFTRRLRNGARSINNSTDAIVSPVDGCISEFGTIDHNRLLQAKGHHYTLQALLGDEVSAQPFIGGEFLTAYLSPKDYHRVHMPLAGELKSMTYVPGRLFSVNAHAVEHVPQLFARNERVINLFQTELGSVAVIFVGAMIVGSIHTQWHGVVTPSRVHRLQRWDYSPQSIRLERGDECGFFTLGSTIILLFESGRVTWQSGLQPGQALRLGELIGYLN